MGESSVPTMEYCDGVGRALAALVLVLLVRRGRLVEERPLV